MKLSKRFLILPVILASFTYLFYSAYKDVRDRTLNEFNSQQFTLAKQATRGIESFFIYYQRELVFLSKLKYVSELNDQGKDLLAGSIEEEKETEVLGLTYNSKYPGKTILIAQDDTSNYDFLRIFLTRMNIRVLWAKDGQEAINLCETDSSIDLVFMDIKMPVIDGFEATRKIKRTRPGLPVIAQTAYTMSTDSVEAIKSGCDDYMSKPIKIKQLTDILEKYL